MSLAEGGNLDASTRHAGLAFGRLVAFAAAAWFIQVHATPRSARVFASIALQRCCPTEYQPSHILVNSGFVHAGMRVSSGPTVRRDTTHGWTRSLPLLCRARLHCEHLLASGSATTHPGHLCVGTRLTRVGLAWLCLAWLPQCAGLNRAITISESETVTGVEDSIMQGVGCLVYVVAILMAVPIVHGVV